MRELITLAFQLLIILLLIINFGETKWLKRDITDFKLTQRERNKNIGGKLREIEIQNALTTILCKYQMIVTGTQDFNIETEYRQRTVYGYVTTGSVFNDWNFKTITAVAKYECECEEIEKMIKKELTNTIVEIKSIKRVATLNAESLNNYKITIELKKL